MWRVGSLGSGVPNAKTQCSACGSPKRSTNQTLCLAKIRGKSSLIGIIRPEPLEGCVFCHDAPIFGDLVGAGT